MAYASKATSPHETGGGKCGCPAGSSGKGVASLAPSWLGLGAETLSVNGHKNFVGFTELSCITWAARGRAGYSRKVHRVRY